VATTRNNKVGRTRKKLAAMLEEALREQGFQVVIDPAELTSNFPYWASPQGGGVSWSGRGLHQAPKNLKGLTVDFCSWDTMGKCIKQGFVMGAGECGSPPFAWEVHTR
jgi:hypothetical protein